MTKRGRRNLSYGEQPSSAAIAKATAVWKLFHKKPEPHELIEMTVTWPTAWEYAGEAVTTYYNSDKWEQDGNYIKYYHDHEGRISIWHPAGMFDWTAKAPRPPRFKQPKAVAVLGYSLGVDVKRHDTDKVRKAIAVRGARLVASPDRKRLWIVEEGVGLVAMIAGPGLAVEAQGIVG
jgi:hypothetical protein